MKLRLLPALLLLSLAAHAADKYLMYVGTYTAPDSKSEGIYAYRYDAKTGALTSLGLAVATKNPSFLVIHPNRHFLYAVNEIGDYKGQKSGAVSAFSIDAASGKLTQLNEVASRGADPCYITIDNSGKYVLVANYTGGSVSAFPIKSDGSLGEASAFVQHSGHGPNAERQGGPHAHSIDRSADNRFALVDDLGLDELLVYKFDDSKGTLTPNDPPFAKLPPGSGPRHFAFNPNGRKAYVVSELASTVTTFDYNFVKGSLKLTQTISTLPKSFTGQNDDAEVEVHPKGKFLYASNRGHDSIAVFTIDQANGTLTQIDDTPTQGKQPRHFQIDPTGTLLFAENHKSDTVFVFKIDQNTGRLTPTGEKLEIGAPVCIKFMSVE